MNGRPSKPQKPGEPMLEVQIHPSDIRRGVWYLFLDRRKLWVYGGALGTVVLFVLMNLVIAPTVIGGLLRRGEYRSLMAERARHGRSLQTSIAELESLGESTDDLHLRMSRIFLTYGLDPEEHAGQGGYPFEAEEPPDSIYAPIIAKGTRGEARIREQLRVLGTFLDEVQSFEEANSDTVRTTPSMSPLEGADFVLTSPYGMRRSPFTKQLDFHPGLDMAATTGTEIRAPADATVVFAGRYPLKRSVSWWRYGDMVALRHGDRFVSLYGHCSEVLVRTGQQVKQGDVIAKVGNTGWSTSPHLHFEIRRRNEEGEFEPVDPRIYILDHRWRDEERLLIRARRAPEFSEYEPLPRAIGR